MRTGFRTWFREEEAQKEAQSEHGDPDKSGGLSDEGRAGTTESRREEVRSKEGHRSANHTTAYIGREAAAGGPQVEREHFWKIFTHVAKLGDGKETSEEDAPLKEFGLSIEKPKISQR